MFTGLITEVGKIQRLTKTGGGIRFDVEAPRSVGGLATHDSVSVNGVCLTVTGGSGKTFMVEAVEETLKKTTLSSLKRASRVNLELALKVGDRMGGHIVQGHVDCVGKIVRIENRESSRFIHIGYPKKFSKYVIPVGSIAVDGVSLTVASATPGEFGVSIIPYTMEQTILKDVAKGKDVNLEFDLIGKYVESMLSGERGERLTQARLGQWGF